ncbi:P1 family peptidase [Paracoccus sp. MC1862]|uniref:P1 family peptidase n=1 Tax=Paracoccus sp. MC1862 TaxID=2760307 RepID=UPI001603679A|nr:P1 family peptidase [Paracoccus sp. MC1862]MBB1497619.1 P1 family peptidase [Paracoccus sp. MC1862]QQO44063.1 P1 family peptidase [Paracoccus sp. MC1862]
MQPGPSNLITDVEGLRVGNAQDARLKSGVTVLTADEPFACGVHVMGGAPGTRETDLLAPDKMVQAVDALVLAGGSAFGLGAAEGVMAGLRAAGRGFAVGEALVPIVPAAILFDLLNGGDKGWEDSPYPALGRRAFEAAASQFTLGTAGAGTGAMTARWKGGLGSASAVLEDGTTVGALVAVNALGSVTAPSGQFWAGPWEMGAEFGGVGLGGPFDPGHEPGPEKRQGEATTIAIVATDAGLDKAALTRLAVAAHDGLARAILPSHTPFDGDLVFAVSTGRRPADPFRLGHAAACTLARAVARGVFEATPAPGDRQPCWREWRG